MRQSTIHSLGNSRRYCPHPLTAFGVTAGRAPQKHHPSRDPQSQGIQKAAQYLYLPQTPEKLDVGGGPNEEEHKKTVSLC